VAPQGLVYIEARPHGAIPVSALKARLCALDLGPNLGTSPNAERNYESNFRNLRR
jgi:hypothetical protein